MNTETVFHDLQTPPIVLPDKVPIHGPLQPDLFGGETPRVVTVNYDEMDDTLHALYRAGVLGDDCLDPDEIHLRDHRLQQIVLDRLIEDGAVKL